MALFLARGSQWKGTTLSAATFPARFSASFNTMSWYAPGDLSIIAEVRKIFCLGSMIGGACGIYIAEATMKINPVMNAVRGTASKLNKSKTSGVFRVGETRGAQGQIVRKNHQCKVCTLADGRPTLTIFYLLLNVRVVAGRFMCAFIFNGG